MISGTSAEMMLDLQASGRVEKNSFHTSRFDTLSAFERVCSDWNLVQDRCQYHHVLMDHRWVKAWWNVFGAHKELHGLIIHHRGQPVGIAPMIYSQGWEAWPSRDGKLQIADDSNNLSIPAWKRIVPIRRVTFPLNIPSHNSRAHMLVADDAAQVCGEIIDYWRDRSHTWDVMALDGLPEGSGQRDLLQAAAASRGLMTLPHGRVREMYSADLTGGMNEYLGRRGSHFRKRHKAQIRACERAGRFEMSMYRGRDIGQGLDIMFEIERDTWKAKTEFYSEVRMPLDVQLKRFFSEVAHAYAAEDDAVIHVMSLDGRPAGALFGLSRRNVMLSLVVYLRDDMRTVLNAAPLWDSLIRDAVERQITELDIHGVTAYARKWATSATNYQRLYIFSPQIRGRMLWASKALATTISRRWAERHDNNGSDDDGRN
ncbi:GNAT family N-acetyltransferase [Microvirga terrestris]|uniref:GNAT family N-acetyltransferase n=1 Tax=Microvirga terrestris TaxID=2791024 RepID=A0ABS0HVI9_9HYPH|nr:GNAT family N-acetyltransferase [Microvirga terrestris]MBF9197533.1 GNAT family N-acetyltransferase [Microvirga terrestris]